MNPLLLKAALETALDFAKEAATVRWSETFGKDDTSFLEALNPSPVEYLIVRLPKVFSTKGNRMASLLMGLWQFGNDFENENGKDGIQFDSSIGYYHVNGIELFKEAIFLRSAVEKEFDKAQKLLRDAFASPEKSPSNWESETWEKLLSRLRDAIEKNGRDKEWNKVAIGDLLPKLDHPDFHLSTRIVTLLLSDDYERMGIKDKKNSDLGQALGNFAIRTYFVGEFSSTRSKSGSYKFSFKPTFLNSRIYDSYDFKSKALFEVSTSVLGLLKLDTTQPLGRWMDIRTGNAIWLQNSDLEEFSKVFRPRYNAIRLEKRFSSLKLPELLCREYNFFSHFVTRPLSEFPTLEIQ